MLRVCGITYLYTTNYGSCFQAYALQKAVERIKVGSGEHCELQYPALWHCKDHFSSEYDNYLYNRILKKFKFFQDNEIAYTECDSVSSISSLNKRFDAFICGSDVIWNPEFNHRLGMYYLDFADKYKFSYGASFGTTTADDSFLPIAGKWISELSDISVREQSSVEIVERCTGRTAIVVPDPVLLLRREDWENIIIHSKKSSKYIFSYATHSSPEYRRFLTRLEATTGLRVVKSIWAKGTRQALKEGVYRIQSPEKWLSQLYNAEYVVTNSFHATVFSSLFHKKFFTVVHGNKDEGANIRMYDYLQRLGMSERMLSSVPENIDLSEINYSGTDRKICEMREAGLQFLQKNLENAYLQKTKLMMI